MKKFMFLLRGGDAMADFSPEEMEQHMAEWKTWMGSLAEQGKLDGGLPLDKAGKQVTKGGSVITDGPYAEGVEVVGGYLIVNANDLDGAVEISKGCPILQGNDANIEIREIMDMN